MNISYPTVSTELLLEFEAIFPGEQPLAPIEYLQGASKDMLLNAASAFLGYKQYKSKYENHKVFLQMFFSPGNDSFANDIYEKITHFQKKERVRIVNPYTSLKLFELFFMLPNEGGEQSDLEFERNLFKSYLILNSQFTKAQSKAFDSTKEVEDSLKPVLTMFCMHYPISDKVNFEIVEIWISQLFKAVYLFEFLDSDLNTKPLLSAFLSYFKCESWQIYLKRILPLTKAAVKNQKESFIDIIIDEGATFIEDCEFIEKLVIQPTDEIEQNDFLTTRASPFYKISAGRYRVIFNLFVVEKIFKGLYFLLSRINEGLQEDHKIPNWRSLYCYEFSEKILLYKIVNEIYTVKCIRYTGQELSDMGIDGAPDYYLRKGKDILLFESKDFLIRADLKASFDFGIYKREFAKTLYFEKLLDGKEKARAVMQLIESIKRILKKEFKADTNYYYKDIFVYPIIVTHDYQYDTPGLNELVNLWFIEELSFLEKEGLFVRHIQPITIINIDVLICYRASFTNGIYLHDIIKEYQALKKTKLKNVNTSDEEYEALIQKKMVPFSSFLRHYIESHDLKKEPDTDKLIAKLF